MAEKWNVMNVRTTLMYLVYRNGNNTASKVVKRKQTPCPIRKIRADPTVIGTKLSE